MCKSLSAGALALAVVWLGTDAGAAQDDKVPNRYEVPADLESYPQTTPKDTLNSVLKALDRKRVDYVLAHLTDPAFVDDRVKKTGKARPFDGFNEFVAEVTAKLAEDPESVKDLRRFNRDGEWMTAGQRAYCKLKGVADRQVSVQKVGDRWFFRNQKEEPKADEEKPPEKDKSDEKEKGGDKEKDK
jgi:hypothetical protein